MDLRFSKDKLVNDKLCKECGGKCCKRCGCSYFPEDFKFELTFDNLKSEIDKGYIAIDAMFFGNSIYEELEQPIYHLRVRNTTDSTPVGISNYGRCLRLEENHCWFSFDDKPSGGKYFIPFWSGCYTLYTNQDLIDLWLPYQEVLMLLIKHYKK